MSDFCELFAKVSSREERAGLFETLLYLVYRDWVAKKNSVAIDIGANRGLHTFRLAECVGPKGRVLAFEPLPELAQRLEEASIEKFGADSQIEVYNKALSDRPGHARFFRNLEADSRSTLIEGHYAGMEREVIDVEVSTIDAVMANFEAPYISIIKIDAEGAEYDILLGARQTLAKCAPMIAVEFSLGQMELVGRTPDDFFDLVDELGYVFFNIDGSPFDRDFAKEGKRHCCYERIGVKAGHHFENYAREKMGEVAMRHLRNLAAQRGVAV